VVDGVPHESLEDVQTLPHRGQGHGPKREHGQEEDSTLLMDATMKGDMPPLALPKREYMERARKIWEELGLPKLRPQAPWFGIRSATGCRSGTRRRSAPSKAAISRTAVSARNSESGRETRDEIPAGLDRTRPLSDLLPHPVCIFH